jgi:aspartate racemase
LIGGTSWESTAIYYRLLNEAIRTERGGSSSAAVTVHSLDFAPVHGRQVAGEWDELGAELADAARALQAGGAEAVAVCANTLHLLAGAIAGAVDVPFLDLIDIVGERCADRGWNAVGLLGTGYTMRSSMYPERLAPYGVKVLTPEEPDAQLVHDVIYEELTRGVLLPQSRARYLEVVETLIDRGAQAVILGCTEVGLLLSDGDARVPLLDTTLAHCEELVRFMLGQELASEHRSERQRARSGAKVAMSARAKSQELS